MRKVHSRFFEAVILYIYVINPVTTIKRCFVDFRREVKNASGEHFNTNQFGNTDTVECESRNITIHPGDNGKSNVIAFLINAGRDTFIIIIFGSEKEVSLWHKSALISRSSARYITDICFSDSGLLMVSVSRRQTLTDYYSGTSFGKTTAMSVTNTSDIIHEDISEVETMFQH